MELLDSELLAAAVAEHAAEGDALRREQSDEADALWNALIDYYADLLWAQEQARPSVLAAIREATGGRMIRPSAPDVAAEYREDIPAHYRRMRNGVAADDVATELGYAGEWELAAAIRAERVGRIHSRAEARRRAEVLAAQCPEWVALQERHMAAWAAWERDHAALVAAYESERRAEAAAVTAEPVAIVPAAEPAPGPAAAPRPRRVGRRVRATRAPRPAVPAAVPVRPVRPAGADAWLWVLLIVLGRLVGRWAARVGLAVAAAVLATISPVPPAAAAQHVHATRRARRQCRACRHAVGAPRPAPRAVPVDPAPRRAA